MRAFLFIGLVFAIHCEAAVVAGRNWRIAIGRIACEDSLLVVPARIDFRGAGGAVEAPIIRLIDGEGRAMLPRGVVWRWGAKPLAEWLSSGGLSNIERGSLGEVEIRFTLPVSSRGLKLEFGDVAPLAITRRDGKAICESFLKPHEIRVSMPARAPTATTKTDFRVHRSRYPCREHRGVRTITAEYPPYLPRQLVVLGRGFLPSAREIELPMGSAPAQAYFYAGADDVAAVEEAARKVVAADFSHYPPAMHFLFNWGTQRSATGNEMYSVGIYELRRCPK